MTQQEIIQHVQTKVAFDIAAMLAMKEEKAKSISKQKALAMIEALKFSVKAY